jgi:outer membrane protein TolC
MQKEQVDNAAKQLNKQVDKYELAINAEMIKVQKIYPAQIQYAYDTAKAALAYTKSAVEYSVEAAYYGLLMAQGQYEVADKARNRAQVQMNNINAKYQQGMVAKMEVLSAQVALSSAQAEQNEAQAAVTAARMALCQLIGLDINTPLTLTDSLRFDANRSVSLDAAISKAFDTDITYLSAYHDYLSKKVEWDEYTSRFSETITYTYRDAQAALTSSEVAWHDAKTALEINVRNAYNDLAVAKENYGVLEKSVELAKEAYRLSLLQYDAGLCTIYDVTDAATSLSQAELGLLSANYTYNMACCAFDYGVYGQ